MKKRMDAKARNIIRNSIDAKAFERSTYDCKTAYELWIALQPTEAYTEEEIHRALGRVRIETCSNDMELVERMYDVVNKAQYAVPDKRPAVRDTGSTSSDAQSETANAQA